MKKTLLFLAFSIFFSGCSSIFGRSKAALQVESVPAATVYLNDSHVGQTIYFDDKLKAGEYNLKLVSEENSGQEWQTQINLSPKIVTVVHREFGSTPEESSYYTLQLEPIASSDTAEISFITTPDNAIVNIDGQPKGLSPISEEITAGDHLITLNAPGYQEQTIKAQARDGYKLNIVAELAKLPDLEAPLIEDNSASPSAEIVESDAEEADDAEIAQPTKKPTPSPTKKPATTTNSSSSVEAPYVTILETGTGWLRVRSAPNASADNEVAKIDVGEDFPFIESDNTGWYKIEYEPGEEGWIAARYADLTEE